MTSTTAKTGEFTAPDGPDPRVKAFVAARLAARSLPAFPGALPASLDDAYALQEQAIGLWPDEIIGWKVGKIPDELQADLGQDRLTGPIFRGAFWTVDNDEPVSAPVFDGGFAAVEAEFVFELLEDAPPAKLTWSIEDAMDVPGRMRIGLEMAGSPLATINDIGPLAVASDFGNNAGLILGPQIADWGEHPVDSYGCQTLIEGRIVGVGSAASLAGGPMESVRFLLQHCARRGRPLKAGQLVSTGAAAGIHDIIAGQSGQVAFGRHGALSCVAVRAEPVR